MAVGIRSKVGFQTKGKHVQDQGVRLYRIKLGEELPLLLGEFQEENPTRPVGIVGEYDGLRIATEFPGGAGGFEVAAGDCFVVTGSRLGVNSYRY